MKHCREHWGRDGDMRLSAPGWMVAKAKGMDGVAWGESID